VEHYLAVEMVKDAVGPEFLPQKNVPLAEMDCNEKTPLSSQQAGRTAGPEQRRGRTSD
jgi:hypothetical protein